MNIGDKVIFNHRLFGVVVSLFACHEDTMAVIATDEDMSPSKMRIIDADSLIPDKQGITALIAEDNIKEQVMNMQWMGLDTQQIKDVLRAVMEGLE